MPKIADNFLNKEKKDDNFRDYLMHEKRFNEFPQVVQVVI